MYHARTKYIDVIRDVILEKVCTYENAVVMLTKPPPTDKFNHYLDLINVSQC